MFRRRNSLLKKKAELEARKEELEKYFSQESHIQTDFDIKYPEFTLPSVEDLMAGKKVEAEFHFDSKILEEHIPDIDREFDEIDKASKEYSKIKNELKKINKALGEPEGEINNGNIIKETPIMATTSNTETQVKKIDRTDYTFLELIAEWREILNSLSHSFDEIEDAAHYFETYKRPENPLSFKDDLTSLVQAVSWYNIENAISIKEYFNKIAVTAMTIKDTKPAVEEIESVIYTTQRRECLDMAGALKELEPYGFNEKNTADITIYKDNKLEKVFLQVKDNVFEVDAEYNDAKKLDFKQFVFKKYVDNEIPSSATKVLNLASAYNDNVTLYDNVSRGCMVSLLEVHKVALESKYMEAFCDLNDLRHDPRDEGTV